MKNILLIGMGKFGHTLGQKLMGLGCEVLAVDKSEASINAVASKYTDALITNCMQEDNLRALDVPSFDACVVAIGDDFQASLQITSLLKELGAKYVVSKAATEIQRKFLLKNGADHVIYPDLDVAERLAITLNSSRIFEYFALNDEYSVIESVVPEKWIGKTLAEANPRALGLNVLTIEKTDKTVSPAEANYVFAAGDHMLVFGLTEKLLAFTNEK